MSLLAPPLPPPPRVTLADDEGRHQIHLRLWQILMTLATVLITAWCCTLGVLPAIIALMIGKHVLVAILAMGLGVDARRKVDA